MPAWRQNHPGRLAEGWIEVLAWAVEEGLEEAAGQDDECSSKDGSGEASNDEPETQSWFRWAASAVGLH